MANLLESINLDRDWLAENKLNITEFDEYSIILNLASKFYLKLHPTYKIFNSFLSFGNYDYDGVCIILNPENQEFIVYNLYLDSMMFHGVEYNIPKRNGEKPLIDSSNFFTTYDQLIGDLDLLYDEVSLIIDRRTIYDQTELFKMLKKKIQNNTNLVKDFVSYPQIIELLEWISENTKQSLEKIKFDFENSDIRPIIPDNNLSLSFCYKDIVDNEDIDKLTENWMNNIIPKKITNTPLFLSLNTGKIEFSQKILDLNLPYLNLYQPYLDGNYYLFGIDVYPKEYWEDIWNFFKKNNVDLTIRQFGQTLLENLLKVDYWLDTSGISLFFDHTYLPEWTRELIKISIQKIPESVFKLNEKGNNLLYQIYDNEYLSLDQKDLLVSLIYNLIDRKIRNELIIERPYRLTLEAYRLTKISSFAEVLDLEVDN